ncbi:MAG: tetratricopeptide repeat protein, partial [bacterium]
DAALAAGERALAEGALAEAEQRFAVLVAETSDPEARAVAQYRLATVARRRGDAERARALLAQVAAGPVEERAALAAYQQAMDAIEAGDPAGPSALRGLVEAYPDSAGADKALKFLASHPGEPADAAATVAWLGDVAAAQARFTSADNALWWSAAVRITSLADLAGARADLRRLIRDFPDSALADDALWRLAQLHLRQGEWAEAEAACQALVDLRNESSLLVGSYRSPLLDDAALLIGALRYHGRRDARAAAWAYDAFLAGFPTSTLRDEAWLGLAQARLAAGDQAGGRRALETLLAEEPESRHAAAARSLLADPRPAEMDARLLAPLPFGPTP